MSETDPKPFLSRWAKRKAASQSGQDEPEATDQLEENTAAVAEEAEEEAALSDEELCARYKLPDPQSCTEEDQLDGFFDGRVPDRLRQLAMRRIWRLNPLFRFADEMVEYGEDFTDAATVIPNMQTAYKVGKGYLDKLLAEEEQAKAEAEAEAIAEEMAADDTVSEEDVTEGQAESARQADEVGTQAHTDSAEEQAEPCPQPETPDDLPASDLARADAVRLPPEPADPVPSTDLPLIRPKRMVFAKNQA